MHKGLVVLCILTCICLVIQLLPLISVPITGESTNYNIRLSTYKNNTFGLFGVCDIALDICSPPKIGYPSKHSHFYAISVEENYDDKFGGIELPSGATYTISKLLVVHVIGFCLTAIIFLLISSLSVILYLDSKGFESSRTALKHFKYKLLKQSNDDNISPASTGSVKPQKRDLRPYLSLILTASLLSFLSTLLAFLVDILLFIPHLSYLGWIQLIPIILLAIMASMVCFIKRTISSRKYLEEEYKTEMDDMRMRNNVDTTRWNDDSASDDGFFIYTNGFYSNYNDSNSHNKGKGGWIRHSPYNDTADEVSNNSSQFGFSNNDNMEPSHDPEPNSVPNSVPNSNNNRTLC